MEPVLRESDGLRCYQRRRYHICFLVLFGYFIMLQLRTNLSISILSITEEHNQKLQNGTHFTECKYEWNFSESGVILASVFYGYIFSLAFGGWLAARFGVKKVLLGALVVPTFISILIPSIAHLSIYAIIIARFFQGLIIGPAFTCNYVFIYRWIPPSERTQVVNITSGAINLGMLSMFAMGGKVAKTIGWEWNFYIPAFFSFAWVGLWIFLTTDDFEKDRYISLKEVEFLRKTIGIVAPANKIKYPVKKFFTSKACWALYLTQLVNFGTFFSLYIRYPSLLKETLLYDMDIAGYLCALPFLTMFMSGMFISFISDYFITKNIMSLKMIRKLTIIIASLAQVICYSSISLVDNPNAIVFFVTMGLTFNTWIAITCYLNWLDIAPAHSSILYGIAMTFAQTNVFVIPSIFNAIVYDKLLSQWRIYFLILASMNLFSSIYYPLLSSVEIQPWAVTEESELSNHNV